MNDCIFCKIIAKQLPSTAIYEDNDVYAFLDIQPVHLGHTLVVPKRHAETLDVLDEEALLKTIRVVRKLGIAVSGGVKAEGYNISQNNGQAAGQTVHHVHFHIIPRRVGDGLEPWPHKTYPSPEEAREVAKNIRAQMAA